MSRRPRKPKVKRTCASCVDWKQNYLASNAARERAEKSLAVTSASLTEQLKAKDARIAELESDVDSLGDQVLDWEDTVEQRDADLQATRDRDDELMAAQRERLIRLTEIKNAGILLMTAFDGVWHDADQDISWELNGTGWVKQRNVFPCLAAANTFSRAIAALEVDSTLPGIPPKGTK